MKIFTVIFFRSREREVNVYGYRQGWISISNSTENVERSKKMPNPLNHARSLTLARTHTLSLSLSLAHTHTLTLSLSLSLAHTNTLSLSLSL